MSSRTAWWTTNTRFGTYLTSCEQDPSWEPFFSELKDHLQALYDIVFSHEERVEGSLYNVDNLTRALIEDRPDVRMLGKRRNYGAYCLTGNSLLEVGFNAGHSALLGLTSNPNLQYTAVDLVSHSYTPACFQYLNKVFGDRICLIEGDSREILPKLPLLTRGGFDLWHIDGGHSYDLAETDLCNVLNLASPGQFILFDDTSAYYLRGLCDFYVMRGYVTPVSLGKLWDPQHQLLLRVEKRVCDWESSKISRPSAL